MKVTVAKKRENVLLGRTEYEMAVEFDGKTPSRVEMRDAIVQNLGCNPDTTVLRRTKGTFGQRRIMARVNVYKKKEDMERAEPEYALLRNKLKGGEKEEKPAEKEEEKPPEKKEEKPEVKQEEKEAPKEEKKEEKAEVKEEKKE
jgi:ribosomal protein S24E